LQQIAGAVLHWCAARLDFPAIPLAARTNFAPRDGLLRELHLYPRR
jgi:hypothetical protein